MSSENALAIRTKISFLILSGCRAGASPASCTKRQPERLPYKQNAFCLRSKRQLGEREREGSAARSAQQRNARPAAPCPARAVRGGPGNIRAACNPRRGNGYRKNRCHFVSNSWR